MLLKQADNVFQYFCMLLFIINSSASSQRKKPNLLSLLLQRSVKRNEPIVVLVEPDTKESSDSLDYTNDGVPIDSDSFIPYNQKRDHDEYLVEKLLRTRNDQASLDEVRNALRALRSRCQTVKRCVRECPEKKPTCPVNCQQVFDKLNLCEPPPRKDPCKKPKCGKTLPPSWRLLL